MIFVGDIAAPSPIFPPAAPLRAMLGEGELAVANLEGPLVGTGEPFLKRKVVFNHPAVVDYLRDAGLRVANLANNHTMDVPAALPGTLARLAESGIATVGAGADRNAAAAEAVVEENGRQRVFAAFGWENIGCRPAGRRNAGVNPLEPRHVLDSVERLRRRHPDATLIVLMHWDYELEIYPMPLQRTLAFRVVDAGADAVIGCHPHCVQGIELHGGAPIVYSLGNWFMAQDIYFDGRLRFPDFASRELAFQWVPETGAMTCHWFDYDRNDHTLLHAGSEALAESAAIDALTPFRGMRPREYAQWFRAHRRKRRLLPVYTDPDAVLTNRLRDGWVSARDRMIRAAMVLRLKGGPR